MTVKKELPVSNTEGEKNKIEFNPIRESLKEQKKLAVLSIEGLMDRRGKKERKNVKTREIFDKACQILEENCDIDCFTFPSREYSHEPPKKIYWKKLKKGEEIEYNGKKNFIHLFTECKDPKDPIKEVEMAVSGSPDSHHFATMRVYIKKSSIKIWRINYVWELAKDKTLVATEMEFNFIENILNYLVLKFEKKKEEIK